jgi:beta-galactosidase
MRAIDGFNGSVKPSMSSRRHFFSQASRVAAGAVTVANLQAAPLRSAPTPTEEQSLSGAWLFRTDPEGRGEQNGWQRTGSGDGWRNVEVPHTWQIEPELTEYRGYAWYRREFDVPVTWEAKAVRVEFEAVFHSATVWVNGQTAGQHLRKGYTAFAFDLSRMLKPGQKNTMAVRVENTFDMHMLPRGRSSDWAHDGGIYRPVQLLVTPKTFVERVDVDASPDFTNGDARLEIAAFITNSGDRAWKGQLSLRVVDQENGITVLEQPAQVNVSVGAARTERVALAANFPSAKLWHFDHPNLYRLEAVTSSGTTESHQFSTIFGVRKLEVRGAQFFFNNEPVKLMGVERMAGSNPEFGMAEPEEWIAHDHNDLKHLNCIFTRVHWPQDKRVFEYCDRHGILMQSEVPTWGPSTFAGMGTEPDADIMRNGIEQLQEMVARDRNHPSIISWGLCNEIEGQNPPAYNFAKHMLTEAKKIDPHRLCSYASQSLHKTPAKDVAGLMDFIEDNEYFGSWSPGGPEVVSQKLDAIHDAFPDKPVVISEYGYCACTSDRPEGDARREEILRTHDEVFRTKSYIGGLIFFCYNDYRTQVGDRGLGVMKQRVHGVVDLYGERKPSYDLLRTESSPIEALEVEGHPNAFSIKLRTRQHVPGYTLKGYSVRGVLYSDGNIPVEQLAIRLADLRPGQELTLPLKFSEPRPWHVRFDVLRPTGFSAFSFNWKP